MYGKNQCNNMMERTTNRVESLNQKIKLVMTRYSNFNIFFNDLTTCVSLSASEKNQKVKNLNKETPPSKISRPSFSSIESKIDRFRFQ